MASFPNLIPPPPSDARPPKGKIDRSFPSLRFTLKQQGFSFWCLCQCLRSQSLDLALRSLSFPRHWKSKATKKFLNKPSQLEPHLVFSLMPPKGRRFPPPHSSRALRGLGSRFLKGASCCSPPPLKDFTCILSRQTAWSRAEHPGNLEGAGKRVLRSLTERTLKADGKRTQPLWPCFPFLGNLKLDI